jgi:hypothetical protein
LKKETAIADMQAEVKQTKEFKLQRDMQMHLLKATGDATSVKIQQKQMQKQSRLMQMQKHQNNCNNSGAILKRTTRQKHIDLLLMLWVKKTLQHSK